MIDKAKDRLYLKYLIQGIGLGALMGFVGVGWGIDWVHFKQREKQIYAQANDYIETKCAEKTRGDRLLDLKFETSNGVHTLKCIDFSKKETCVLDSVTKPQAVNR